MTEPLWLKLDELSGATHILIAPPRDMHWRWCAPWPPRRSLLTSTTSSSTSTTSRTGGSTSTPSTTSSWTSTSTTQTRGWQSRGYAGPSFRHRARVCLHASQWLPRGHAERPRGEYLACCAHPTCGWQSRGSDFPQTSLCHFFVVMHHNGFREVRQFGREGKTLHAVH